MKYIFTISIIALLTIANVFANNCTPEEYLRRRPDVARAGMEAKYHYDNHGKNEGMCNPILTSSTPAPTTTRPLTGDNNTCTKEEYLRRRPDVARAGMDAKVHYDNHGKNEGMCNPILQSNQPPPTTVRVTTTIRTTTTLPPSNSNKCTPEEYLR